MDGRASSVIFCRNATVRIEDASEQWVAKNAEAKKTALSE